jgi:hypothetical protein
MMELGPLECALDLYGADKGKAAARYRATSAGSALIFRIDALRLPVGSYAAEINALGKFPVGRTVIEVTPVQAALLFAGNTVDENERGVLRRSVEQALQQYGVPAQIADAADRYAVAITLEAVQQSPLLTAGTVEFAFTLDGKSLASSGRKHISETNHHALFLGGCCSETSVSEQPCCGIVENQDLNSLYNLMERFNWDLTVIVKALKAGLPLK